MSNLQDYNEKIGIISEIPDEKVKNPNTPVDVAIQEAETTNYWANKDREALTSAGLSDEIIDDIPGRAGACREAQSRWNEKYKEKKKAEREWRKKAPGAYELRNIMLHKFRFAYRTESHLPGRVSAIGKGNGHADLFQDLNDMAVLGRTNPEPLKTIGFDMSLLDKAARVSDEMASLYSRVKGERKSSSEAKLIRDKAYMHMKEAVDKVREYGKFVFWRDKERKKRYTSAYIRKKNQKRQKAKELESKE